MEDADDRDIDVSVAVDEPELPKERVEPNDLDVGGAAQASEEAPVESAATRIRSLQQTVPGLSPLDALDEGWDAPKSITPRNAVAQISIEASSVAQAPSEALADAIGQTPSEALADAIGQTPSEALADAVAQAPSDTATDTDRSPSAPRAYTDIPTPVVPIDFAGFPRPNDGELALISHGDRDEQTVVRADPAAHAAAADEDAERALARIADADQEELTVVRADASSGSDPAEAVTNPLATVAPIEPEALTDPLAAPSPDDASPPAPLDASAAPPPRVPVGLLRLMPPPLARGSAPPPPPSRKVSLPPPPSLDKTGAVAAPPPRRSRPMPLPPRRTLPPSPAAASASSEESPLDATPGVSPMLAPPSLTALSVPPPPPPAPAPVPRAVSLPPPPAPPSKRSAASPPMPTGGATDVVVAIPPAAAKVGPSENTPTIQVSAVTGRSEPADFTPTVQVQRTHGMGVPRALPPPARVPVFSEVPASRAHGASEPIRPKSSSIAPLVDSIPPPAMAAGSRRFLAALAALVLGVAAIFFGLNMRSGSVIVTVSSESGGAVKDVEVKIDDTIRCHSTPCEVKGLEPGAHFVSASAAGLAAGAQRAFTISPGGRAAEHVALGSAEKTHAELSVSGAGEGLRVFVDGRDLGAPPVVIRDIDPDTHVVRVTGPGRAYEPYEETVRLEAGESRSLGPVRLKLLRGRLELVPGEGAEDATVIVDGRRVPRLPAAIEVAADQAHEVTAQRRGFSDFSEEVVFDNTATRTVEITLSPGGRRHGTYPSSNPAPVSAKRAVASSPAPSGMATLDVVSTPPTHVVINGRPMGSTPLRGVKVPAGPQTVVFVHPSLGRKIASTAVAPGGHGSVGVKF